jgi:uncharacterized membrane protein HdeD (DUF308 family)
MITFGYKSRFNGPVRALTAIAVGVVMVVSKTNALELAVRIIAAFLAASGIVSLLIGYKNKANGAMGLMGFNAAVDIILGFLLFLFPGFAAGLLIYLISFVLIAFGMFQLISMISANRVLKVGVLAFVMPLIVLAAGLFLLARPAFIGEALGLVAGIALIIYGVSELLSSWKMKKAIDESVKDVDYEKVDEQ